MKLNEYADGNFWFTRSGTTLTVGLTGAALERIGSLQALDLPEEDTEVSEGAGVGEVQGTLGMLSIVAPASGRVIEQNAKVLEDMEVVSDDPTDEGWLFKFEEAE